MKSHDARERIRVFRTTGATRPLVNQIQQKKGKFKKTRMSECVYECVRKEGYSPREKEEDRANPQ